MWWGPSKILTNQNSAGARTGLWGNQVQKGQCAHRVMGKSSAKRSMRAQARAQGYGEIKCKKVNARTGARTGLWGNQVQKGQCAHRRAHRVMGKSSAKRSMRAQACAQGYGEIKCKKVNVCTGARTGEIKCKKVNAHTGAHTGLWGNQVQKGQ